MSIETAFPNTEPMEQALANGTDEGLRQAVSQIDAILAETSQPMTDSARRKLRP